MIAHETRHSGDVYDMRYKCVQIGSDNMRAHVAMAFILEHRRQGAVR